MLPFHGNFPHIRVRYMSFMEGKFCLLEFCLCGFDNLCGNFMNRLINMQLIMICYECLWNITILGGVSLSQTLLCGKSVKDSTKKMGSSWDKKWQQFRVLRTLLYRPNCYLYNHMRKFSNDRLLLWLDQIFWEVTLVFYFTNIM